MSTPPRVSVIVPTVRVDDWLRAALQSLLAQTAELEVVVVLDGVEDTTGMPRHECVRTVTLPKRSGSAAAINAGAAVARGEFIGRLDADDLAEPGRVAAQVALLDADPGIVAVGTAATVIDDAGNTVGAIDPPAGTDLARGLLRKNLVVHSSVLIRRSALVSVGGYDTRCVRMQDYDLWLRLARVGRVTNLPGRLTRYRVHATMHSRETSPFSASATRIRASRLALARHLGRSVAGQTLRNLAWTASQSARHWGLRRPRYLTR
jgi:glycosyltransferase involved in cell wall biosynthesis